MSLIDEGIVFQNEIREFMVSLGFTDVPAPQSGENRQQFFLGGQEIDSFGRDGELYVVIDAKTRSSLARRSRGRGVRSYLSIINGYKHEVIEDIRSRYGQTHGYREAVFVFWTKNIKIDNGHQQRARELGIALRDEFDLRYYEQALRILVGKAIIRNSFLKDLSLQLPPGLRIFSEGHSINVKAIRTRFGTKTLYTFPIEVRNLLKFAYVFRVEMNSIVGESYQRLLKGNKISKIRDYLERRGGYFPNNLITISEQPVEFIPETRETGDTSFTFGQVRLPDKACYLEILDGQHRLYSYSNLPDKQNHCLWVTIIENLTPVDRARLFVTINKTQTKVPAFILWDLYQITDPNGIQGRISKFVYQLNEEEPFKDMIRLPRVRSSRAFLSFPNFCSSLYRRSNLYSHYGSESSFMNAVRAYFAKISSDTELRVDWNRSIEEKGKTGFICTNSSISVLLRLLAKVLERRGLPPSDEIQSWKADLNDWIVIPLKGYLANNADAHETEDPYHELRKLTSEKARKDAADTVWSRSPLSHPS